MLNEYVHKCEIVICDKDATRELSYDTYNAWGELVQVRDKLVCDFHSTYLSPSKSLISSRYVVLEPR